MKGTLVPAEKLSSFMLEHGLSQKDIMGLTDSGLRTIVRWLRYGTPVSKWDLLVYRFNDKSK